MPSVGKIMANVFWDHKDMLIVDSLDNGSTAATKCYCGTLETLWQATVTKSLVCYAMASLCMVTTTRTVPHYHSTCVRFHSTLPTIPLPCPVSLKSWTHHEAPHWHAIYSGCWYALRWHLLATDSWHQFLMCQDISLGVQAGQMFKCQWRL
jgi:hypothetical protein